MPNQAHEIFNSIKSECIDALVAIAGDLPGAWCADAEGVQEGEWKDRDGFWSYNNGNVEFMFPANASTLYYNGHGNKYIQRYIDGIREDILDATRDLDDCPKDLDDDALYAWMVENHPDVEETQLEYADEATPFVRGVFMLKAAGGRQFTGEVDDDTALDLQFRFAFNDDFGYGRTWCQGGYYGKEGFGDRDVVWQTFRFTRKDLEWLKGKIGEMPGLVSSTPDSTEAKETVVLAPSLQ